MKKLIIGIVLAVLVVSCGQPSQYVQISGYAQGSNYTVKMNMKGVSVPVESIRDSIDALILQIDTTLSGYNKKSLISRFNAGEKIPSNAMFLDMYRIGYRLWERSGGALDFGAAPLYDAWGFGFRNSSFPTDEQIRALLDSCGMGHLPAELPVVDGYIDPAAMGNPKLNYNAIAQGYSCDLIAHYLYSIGVKDMLVDIGEIWCDGVNPNGEPWSVGIDRPVDQTSDGRSLPEGLDGIWSSGAKPAGIVTSGNYRKFYIRNGRKFSHTINPRTGYPVEHNLLSATVVSSKNAAESDAIATWCMVIGLQGAQVLILGDPALEGYLIYTDASGEMKEWASPGFTLKK
ncbi:MAG: FAD:protein FMN transferase [Bacteroidales bacterium]|nr:FAD:protein FMN transferase [Bacteroidales bacterium]